MMLWILWGIAVVVAIFCAIVSSTWSFTGKSQIAHWIIIVLWTMGPPTWFLIDATRRIHMPDDDGKLTPKEQFFYDSAGKFWAGYLALLTAIYAFRKFNG